HGERFGARGGRAAGSRPRIDRRAADVREIASHARISARGRVGDRARDRAREDAVWARGPTAVSIDHDARVLSAGACGPGYRRPASVLNEWGTPCVRRRWDLSGRAARWGPSRSALAGAPRGTRRRAVLGRWLRQRERVIVSIAGR